VSTVGRQIRSDCPSLKLNFNVEQPKKTNSKKKVNDHPNSSAEGGGQKKAKINPTRA
jgi:hypothetical protein